MKQLRMLLLCCSQATGSPHGWSLTWFLQHDATMSTTSSLHSSHRQPTRLLLLPGFCSVKQQAVLFLPPLLDGMLVYHRVTPQHFVRFGWRTQRKPLEQGRKITTTITTAKFEIQPKWWCQVQHSNPVLNNVLDNFRSLKDSLTFILSAQVASFASLFFLSKSPHLPETLGTLVGGESTVESRFLKLLISQISRFLEPNYFCFPQIYSSLISPLISRTSRFLEPIFISLGGSRKQGSTVFRNITMCTYWGVLKLPLPLPKLVQIF